jgi:hypothetical protein
MLAACRPPAREGPCPGLPGQIGDPFECPHSQQAQQQQVVRPKLVEFFGPRPRPFVTLLPRGDVTTQLMMGRSLNPQLDFVPERFFWLSKIPTPATP